MICSTCEDTHRMVLHRDGEVDRVVMCTRCPIPCSKCRGKGQSAYCKQTPCDCKCHGEDTRLFKIYEGDFEHLMDIFYGKHI